MGEEGWVWVSIYRQSTKTLQEGFSCLVYRKLYNPLSIHELQVRQETVKQPLTNALQTGSTYNRSNSTYNLINHHQPNRVPLGRVSFGSFRLGGVYSFAVVSGNVGKSFAGIG